MFKPEDRQIFAFHDRKGPRSIDPQAAYDVFLEAIGHEDPELLFEMERAASRPADLPPEAKWWPEPMVFQESLDARRKLVRAIATAFGVSTVAEDEAFGLSEYDLFRLYYELIAYLVDLKKNIGRTPNGSPPTALPGNSPTSDTSDSSGTANASA